MSDVFYKPEEYGLTLIGDVQWGEQCYDFDMTAVWEDKTGQLYMASDSGCSCPSPFEDYISVDDLDKVTKHEALEFLSTHSDAEDAADLIGKLASR